MERKKRGNRALEWCAHRVRQAEKRILAALQADLDTMPEGASDRLKIAIHSHALSHLLAVVNFPWDSCCTAEDDEAFMKGYTAYAARQWIAIAKICDKLANWKPGESPTGRSAAGPRGKPGKVPGLEGLGRSSADLPHPARDDEARCN